MESIKERFKNKKALIITVVVIAVLSVVLAGLIHKSPARNLLVEARYNIGHSRPFKAIELLNRALKTNPDDKLKPQLYTWRSVAYTHLMKYEKAEKDLFKALEFKNADRAFVYSRLAIIYQKTDQIEKFMKYFQLLQKKRPSLIIPMPGHEGFEDALFMAAEYHSLKGEYEKAAVVYSNMLLISPERKELYFERAVCRFNAGHKEQARQDAKTWMEFTPPQERELDDIAVATMIMGEYDQTLEILEKIRKIYPDYPFYYYYRGRVFYHMGNKKAARKELEKFINIHGKKYPLAYNIAKGTLNRIKK